MLVLVIGPSGVGKDTLIAYCRARLAGKATIVFPRRTVTRPAGDETEDHDAVSEEEFRQRDAAGAFALRWQAHGLSYGVPVQIDDDLAAGRTVVANVSRSIIDETRAKYPNLRIVCVTASPEILARRLQGRGREGEAEIARRLERARSVAVEGPDVVILDNSGAPEEAGGRLLELVMRAG